MKPKMFYFGPWDQAGHYLFSEKGRSVYHEEERGTLPWHEMGYGGKPTIDGNLQPRGPKPSWHREGPELPQGVAALHHLNGWTALSFWDRSVDTRGACNSTYFAEGTFTFEEMVEMSKTRFSERWNRMKFEVVPMETPCPQ